ncbi:Vacuolar import and degradation protein 27 [Colletotrichum sp. SAR 10_77]|nr:Vacuolar import and degradation protein 27 [Colletotrichum sp. SAR 10_77]
MRTEDDAQRSEHYDSDEEEDDVATKDEDGNVNSQLAIGVFKHTPNNNLDSSTNISKVEMPQGTLFSPKKVMLHNEGHDMILQNETDPNKLYRMDLKYEESGVLKWSWC